MLNPNPKLWLHRIFTLVLLIGVLTAGTYIYKATDLSEYRGYLQGNVVNVTPTALPPEAPMGNPGELSNLKSIGPGGGGAVFSAAFHNDYPNTPIILAGQDVGGLSRSTDGGLTWEHTNQNGVTDLSGDAGVYGITSITGSPHNDELFIATSWNSLFVSANTGDSWTLHAEEIAFSSAAFSPTNSNLIFVGAGDARDLSGDSEAEGLLYRSADNGTTFAQVSMISKKISSNPDLFDIPNIGTTAIRSLAFDNNGTLYMATNKGLLKSISNLSANTITFEKIGGFASDNGHWIGVATDNTIWYVLQNSCASDPCAYDTNEDPIGYKGGIYQLKNGETSWNKIPETILDGAQIEDPDGINFRYESLPPNFFHGEITQPHIAQIDPTNPNTFFINMRGAGGVGGTYKYENGTWISILDPSSEAFRLHYATTAKNVWGSSWSTSPEGLAISPDGNTLLVLAESNIYKSEDKGSTWTNLSSTQVGPAEDKTWQGRGNEVTVAYDIAIAGNIIYMAMEDSGAWKSTDGGETWKHLMWQASDPLWPIGDDKGQTRSDAASHVFMNPNNTNEVYFAFSSWSNSLNEKTRSTLFISTNGGTTMTQIRPPVGSDTVGRASIDIKWDAGVESAPGIKEDLIIISFVGANNIYISDNSGATWTTAELPNNENTIFELAIDPDDSSTFYAGLTTQYGNEDLGGNGGFYKSTDRGTTWNKKSIDTTNEPKNISVVEFAGNPRLYVAGWTADADGIAHGGLYISDNKGDSFTKILSQPFVNDVLTSPKFPKTVYAASSIMYRKGSNIEAGIYRSEQNGNANSWTRISGDLPHALLWGLGIKNGPEGQKDILYMMTGGDGVVSAEFTDKGEVVSTPSCPAYTPPDPDFCIDGWKMYPKDPNGCPVTPTCEKFLRFGYINTPTTADEDWATYNQLFDGTYTHIISTFARPTTNGELQIDNNEAINTFNASLRNKAKNAGTLALFSVGGATVPYSTYIELASNTSAQTTFMNNIIKVLQNDTPTDLSDDYDGVDINFEGWSADITETQRTSVDGLVRAIADRVKTEKPDAVVTTVLAPLYWLPLSISCNLLNENITSQNVPLIDFAHHMSYDFFRGNPGVANGPFKAPGEDQWLHPGTEKIERSVNGALQYLINKGCPANKLTGGIPFYGTTNDILWNISRDNNWQNVCLHPNYLEKNKADGDSNEWINDPEAAKAKTLEYKNMGLAGVMVWQVGQEGPKPELSIPEGNFGGDLSNAITTASADGYSFTPNYCEVHQAPTCPILDQDPTDTEWCKNGIKITAKDKDNCQLEPKCESIGILSRLDLAMRSDIQDGVQNPFSLLLEPAVIISSDFGNVRFSENTNISVATGTWRGIINAPTLIDITTPDERAKIETSLGTLMSNGILIDKGADAKLDFGPDPANHPTVEFVLANTTCNETGYSATGISSGEPEYTRIHTVKMVQDINNCIVSFKTQHLTNFFIGENPALSTTGDYSTSIVGFIPPNVIERANVTIYLKPCIWNKEGNKKIKELGTLADCKTLSNTDGLFTFENLLQGEEYTLTFGGSEPTATCNNNLIEVNEVCDSTGLAGESCTTKGFDGGTLSCNDTCDNFDTSACTTAPTQACGNNTIEGTEVCDGTSLGGKQCTDFGYDKGTLTCNSTCDGFNETQCLSTYTWTREYYGGYDTYNTSGTKTTNNSCITKPGGDWDTYSGGLHYIDKTGTTDPNDHVTGNFAPAYCPRGNDTPLSSTTECLEVPRRQDGTSTETYKYYRAITTTECQSDDNNLNVEISYTYGGHNQYTDLDSWFITSNKSCTTIPSAWPTTYYYKTNYTSGGNGAYPANTCSNNQTSLASTTNCIEIAGKKSIAPINGRYYDAKRQTLCQGTSTGGGGSGGGDTGATICGDGDIEGIEMCDDGSNNGQYNYCKADCTGPGPKCGDFITDNGYGETCDDGNTSSNDGCSNTCIEEVLYVYCNYNTTGCNGFGLGSPDSLCINRINIQGGVLSGQCFNNTQLKCTVAAARCTFGGNTGFGCVDCQIPNRTLLDFEYRTN